MPLLFVMVSPTSLDDTIGILNGTVMHCPQRIDPGVFGLNSKIIFFIAKNNKANVYHYAKKIFENWYFQRTAFVAIAKEQCVNVSYEVFHIVGIFFLVKIFLHYLTKPTNKQKQNWFWCFGKKIVSFIHCKGETNQQSTFLYI